eukprot:12402507-Karenia_brevis.AAC.1
MEASGGGVEAGWQGPTPDEIWLAGTGGQWMLHGRDKATVIASCQGLEESEGYPARTERHWTFSCRN